MLKFLRNKKTAKRIWITLAAIIVPAFIFWGGGSAVRTRDSQRAVGRIFGRSISMLEFKDSLDAVRIQALLRFGEKFPEVEKSLFLEAQAWERLLLLAEARKRGIRVKDSAVIQEILRLPFADAAGRFDRQRYSQFLQTYLRLSPRAFEEQTRQNLAIAQLFEEITGGVSASEQEVQEEYRKANEKISIWYAAGLMADYLNEIEPSPDELRAYFQEHAVEFKQPLSFNLEFCALDAGSAAPEEIQRRAKQMLSRVRRKEPFAAVAQSFGLEVKETGRFAETDPIPGIGWSVQISSLLFKAKDGEYLPPIQAEKQLFIVRVKERIPPAVPPLEQIQEQVKEAYRKEQAAQRAKTKVGDCLRKFKDDFGQRPTPQQFQETAATFGLKAAQSEPFSFDSYIEGIGASDIFWLNAQALKEGACSDIITTANGYFLILLKEKTAFDQAVFQKELPAFTQKVMAQKKQEQFVRFITALKEQAQR